MSATLAMPIRRNAVRLEVPISGPVPFGAASESTAGVPSHAGTRCWCEASVRLRGFIRRSCRVSRMDFSLRPFVTKDIEQVVALSLRAWEPVHASLAGVLGPDINRHVTPDWRQSQEAAVRKACAEQLTTVAVRDEAVVGFVSVLIEGPQEPGEIYMLAVDPAAQRAGVGRALTDHALSQIRDAGCAVAVVSTGGDPGHAPARALYEACGFTTELRIVNYYRLVEPSQPG